LNCQLDPIPIAILKFSKKADKSIEQVRNELRPRNKNRINPNPRCSRLIDLLRASLTRARPTCTGPAPRWNTPDYPTEWTEKGKR